MANVDGKRQMSVAVNLQRWNELDSAGKPRPHAIDAALTALYDLAMCGLSLGGHAAEGRR